MPSFCSLIPYVDEPPNFEKIAPWYAFLPQGIVLARDSPGRKTRGKATPDEITYLQTTNTEARVQYTLKSKCEFAIYRYQVVFSALFLVTRLQETVCMYVQSHSLQCLLRPKTTDFLAIVCPTHH